MNKDNYNESFFGISDFVDGFSRFLGDAKQNIVEKLNTTNDFKLNLYDTVPYRYSAENGLITIEAVVAGHTAECIKVCYDKESKILKIEDNCDIPEENRPWYLNELKLKFKLPETTSYKTFVKNLQNGVLTVTAKYYENQVKDKENTEIFI